MKKKYLQLTKEQKDRGVIFSSVLIPKNMSESLTIHEVMQDDENKNIIIERLLDDKFFNDSPYQYNLIRK